MDDHSPDDASEEATARRRLDEANAGRPPEEKGPFDSDHYYSIGDAYDEVKQALKTDDAKAKALAGAKLVGKSLFNTGLFAGKFGVAFVKQLPEQLAGHAEKQLAANPDMSKEERKKLEDIVQRVRNPGEKHDEADES
jgi:hypothetical protein